MMLVVSACSSEDPTPTPKPAAAAPAAAAAKPTPTPAPTATPAPKRGGTLAYWIRSNPPNWDPWGTTRFWDPTRKIMEMVFNPLYSPAAQFGDSCVNELEPEIAESWSFVDPTTLQFKLRQGIKWHNKPPLNGRELKADDVVYTFNERYAKGPAAGAYVGKVFFDKAEKVDDYTVNVLLKKPFDFIQGWPSGNRQGHIVAPEADTGKDAEGKPGAWRKDPTKSWVGTGPFMFDSFENGVKVSFSRNPDYFKDGLPYADKVDAHIIPDAATRLAALRSGKINIFPAASPRVLEEIRSTNKDFFTKSCPSLFHLGVRIRYDKAPWNDVRVRRALSMALDRDAIIKTALRGDGMAANVGWPLDPEALKLGDYPEETAQYLKYNPEKAKALLAEAGYPNGFDTKVVWTQAYGSPWQEVSEAMLTMLRGVGINAEFDIQEYRGGFRTMGSKHNFESLYFGWTNSFDMGDLAATYFWSGMNPPNGFNYPEATDATLDAMVEKLWGAQGGDDRKAALEELQVYVADQAIRITSPVWGNGIVTRAEVKNVGWRGTNKMYHQIFENAWIDK